MPKQSQISNPLADLVAWLAAHETTRLALEASAPRACAANGGAESIMDRLGGHMIRRGWWSIDFRSAEGEAIWEQIAHEHQQQFRES